LSQKTYNFVSFVSKMYWTLDMYNVHMKLSLAGKKCLMYLMSIFFVE